jgi:dihydroorotase
VRKGLADGTIDIVATDHAPHPSEDKDCEWSAAAFGMTGLESALAIVNETMVASGLMKWKEVADRMSTAPARIGKVADQGQPLKVGAPANIVVFNPGASYVVDPAQTLSGSRNTPYRGRTLNGEVVATFYKGKPTVLEGKLA